MVQLVCTFGVSGSTLYTAHDPTQHERSLLWQANAIPQSLVRLQYMRAPWKAFGIYLSESWKFVLGERVYELKAKPWGTVSVLNEVLLTSNELYVDWRTRNRVPDGPYLCGLYSYTFGCDPKWLRWLNTRVCRQGQQIPDSKALGSMSIRYRSDTKAVSDRYLIDVGPRVLVIRLNG